MSEPEVRELEDPSGVDEAVARLEVAVVHYVAIMQVHHALASKLQYHIYIYMYIVPLFGKNGASLENKWLLLFVHSSMYFETEWQIVFEIFFCGKSLPTF
jgi:hypothetical protein